MKSKGVSPLVAFVIYTAIIVSALGITIVNLTPVIENLKDGLEIRNAENVLLNFDNKLDSISLGKFSSSNLDVRFGKGKFIFNSSTNSFSYEIETEKEIISSGVNTKIGLINYSSQENKAILSLNYNSSRLILTGNDFSLFPGRREIIIANLGLVDDVLNFEVERD